MKYLVGIMLIFIVVFNSNAEENFNREILERLVRMETKMDNLQRQIDDLKIQRQDDKTEINANFDRLYTFLYWAIGTGTSVLFLMCGFILWDRRTAVAPLARKSKDIEDKLSVHDNIFKLLANQRKLTPEYLKELGIL